MLTFESHGRVESLGYVEGLRWFAVSFDATRATTWSSLALTSPSSRLGPDSNGGLDRGKHLHSEPAFSNSFARPTPVKRRPLTTSSQGNFQSISTCQPMCGEDWRYQRPQGLSDPMHSARSERGSWNRRSEV